MAKSVEPLSDIKQSTFWPATGASNTIGNSTTTQLVTSPAKTRAKKFKCKALNIEASQVKVHCSRSASVPVGLQSSLGQVPSAKAQQVQLSDGNPQPLWIDHSSARCCLS